jgi:hypothetical protein
MPQLAQAPTSTGYEFGPDATRAGLLLLPGSVGMLVPPPAGAVGAAPATRCRSRSAPVDNVTRRAWQRGSCQP